MLSERQTPEMLVLESVPCLHVNVLKNRSKFSMMMMRLKNNTKEGKNSDLKDLREVDPNHIQQTDQIPNIKIVFF